MDNFLGSLAVTLIGLVGVFVILIILTAMAKLLVFAGKSGSRKQESSALTSAAPAAQQQIQAQGISPEVVAVISAAIAAYSRQTGQSGLVVRSIRRTQHAPAWNQAGRNEQILNRF